MDHLSLGRSVPEFYKAVWAQSEAAEDLGLYSAWGAEHH